MDSDCQFRRFIWSRGLRSAGHIPPVGWQARIGLFNGAVFFCNCLLHVFLFECFNHARMVVDTVVLVIVLRSNVAIHFFLGGGVLGQVCYSEKTLGSTEVHHIAGYWLERWFQVSTAILLAPRKSQVPMGMPRWGSGNWPGAKMQNHGDSSQRLMFAL